MTLMTLQNTGIVVDSTIDPWAHFQGIDGLVIVPLKVLFGDEAFDDGTEISIEQFYERLNSSPVIPTSSQPSPARFAAAYQEMCERFEHVLSIHISEKMSGTVKAAREAAAGFPRVEVIDSRFVSGAHGLLVERLRARLRDGISHDDLMAYVDYFHRRGQIIIHASSLEYLRRGGRIGRSQQAVGGLLGIHPVIQIIDGAIEAVGKPRGERRADDMLIDCLRQNVGPDEHPYVGLLYAGTPEVLPRLRERVLEARPDAEIITEGSVGCVVGVHIGPQAAALMFVA
jgi:DegV family protein with EDD domain